MKLFSQALTKQIQLHNFQCLRCFSMVALHWRLEQWQPLLPYSTNNTALTNHISWKLIAWHAQFKFLMCTVIVYLNSIVRSIRQLIKEVPGGQSYYTLEAIHIIELSSHVPGTMGTGMWSEECDTTLMKCFYTKLFPFPGRNRSQNEENGQVLRSWLLSNRT